MTFNVPQLLPDTMVGYEFFNFFFALPLIVVVLAIIPLVCIYLIMRS
jgi:hypothetical protein